MIRIGLRNPQELFFGIGLDPVGRFSYFPATPSWLMETITVLSLFANDPDNWIGSGNQMPGYSVTGVYLF